MALGITSPRIARRTSNGTIADALSSGGAIHNVARPERLLSVALGAALATYGARRRDSAGIAVALLGGALVARGASGHCPVYHLMGVSTGSADAVLGPPPVVRRGAFAERAYAPAEDEGMDDSATEPMTP